MTNIITFPGSAAAPRFESLPVIQARHPSGMPARIGDRVILRRFGNEELRGWITGTGAVLGPRNLQTYTVHCHDGITRPATADFMEVL